jgi:uncharacterized ion transporter superfamily protein YfcC
MEFIQLILIIVLIMLIMLTYIIFQLKYQAQVNKLFKQLLDRINISFDKLNDATKF